MFALSALTAGSANAQTQIVTACDEAIVSRDAALGADLDCSASGGTLSLPKGTRLDLAGFELTGQQNAIFCSKRCEISGGTVTVVAATTGPVTAIGGAARVSIDDVVINSPGQAVNARKAFLSALAVSGSGCPAIYANRRLSISDSIVEDCTDGTDAALASARFVDIRSSVVTGNRFGGARAAGGRVRVRDSVVDGNGTDPGCGATVVCADIQSSKRPKLSNSTCSRSYDPNACEQAGSGFCSLGGPLSALNAPTTNNHGACLLD